MNAAACKAACILALLLPSTAAADSALLPHFNVGALLTTDPAAFFSAGLGLDWIDASGLTLGADVGARHDLRTTYALSIGWAGAGMLEGDGLPLGVALGPALGYDLERGLSLGGRATFAWSLWYRRVTLELSGSLYREVGHQAREAPFGDVSFSLVVAPVAPLRFD